MSIFIPCADDDPRRNLENKRFGRLLVLKCLTDKLKQKGYSRLVWQCECECGNIVAIRGLNLINNATKSCGCFQKECLENHRLHLDGKRFGCLTVTKCVGVNKYQQTLWECKCDCGNVITVIGNSLVQCEKTNCGCIKTKYKLNKNLLGVKFDDWTVVERAENRITPNGQSRVRWKCVNSKGETKIVFSTYIVEKLKSTSKKK